MTAPRSGSSAPLLMFSHGNSFPGGTYNSVLRSLRARGYHARAIDKFGHDPRYPVTSNWPHLVRQLHDITAEAWQEHATSHPEGALYLVGHSLGGFLSIMCAALHPVIAGKRVDGVVLLDSPLISGWRARALEVAKRTRLVGTVSPGRVSRKRRNQWPNEQAVWDHFAGKKAFALWDPQALQDYISHGTHDETTSTGTRRVLSFDREVETRIYNTLPHHLDRLLNRHPLQCPVAFVGGTQSAEMKQVGMAMTLRVVGKNHPERLQMVEGTHLFPMEQPLQTAAAVDTALRSFQAPPAR